MSQLTTPNRMIQAANGTSYAYRRYGKSGATPVVFLQSPCSAPTWCAG